MSEQGSTVEPVSEESGSMPAGPDVDSGETPAPKKKKASTLRRAFSWLRGRRKKKKTEKEAAKAKKQEEKAKAKSRAAIKAEEDKRQALHKGGDQQHTDNVFFPSSRPPELEELHIQAQEGLKSQQHQEKHKHTKNDKDQTDATSIVSSPVLPADGDDSSVAFRGRSMSCAIDNANEDTLSIRSEMIQRTGSTFRPHDASKKSERSGKKRKERRTTVVGVPQHIQKELGIHHSRRVQRGTLDIFQRDDAHHASAEDRDPPKSHLLNGGEPGPDVVFIPTVDGSMKPLSPAEGGVHVSLQALEGGRTQTEIEADAEFQIHMHKVYYDDTNLGKKTAVRMSPLLRPKSLAVPGMTTHGLHGESMGPVMSISPQGTYMSKIIPNAILPPMVDVIALTKNSVRTLSRCSLAAASPASVRSSQRSYHSRHNSSSSENWSHSQSTETIVSNTSTISSRGGSTSTLPNEKGEPSREKDSRTPPAEVLGPRPADDQLSLSSAAGFKMNGSAAGISPSLLMVQPLSGRVSPAFSIGSTADASDTMSIASDRSSIRNVSLRKSKKPPAPPRRTYSLQQQRELGLPPKPEKRPPAKAAGNVVAKDPWVKRTGTRSPGAEDEVFTPSLHEETVRVWSESPAYAADAASPVISGPKPLSPEHFERTTSPSSGYSSQSGTPTLSTKGVLDYSSSPRLRRPQAVKQERDDALLSNVVSISSPSTSISSSTSDSTRLEAATTTLATQQPRPAVSATSAPSSDFLSKVLLIPPHPKVPAPSCPPPSKAKPKLKALFFVPSVASPVPQESTSSTAAGKPPGHVKTGNSPPPSPPPSYQPPPPPTRKSESDTDGPPSAPAKDSSWPPPPPPVPDVHDLSMADFPPPEEEYFDAPLPGASNIPPESEPSPAEPSDDLPKVSVPPPTRIPAPAALSFSARVSSRIQQQGGSHLPQQPDPAGGAPPAKLPGASVSQIPISGARLPKSSVITTAALAGSAALSSTNQTTVDGPAPLPSSSAPASVPAAPAPQSATAAPAPQSAPAPPPAPIAPAPPPAPGPPLAPAPPPAPVAPAPLVPAPPPAPEAPTLKAVPPNFRTQSLRKPSPVSGAEATTNITRGKGNQSPKEDATLPIVTPSLLQMVRLRSVQAGGYAPTEPKTQLQNQNGPPASALAPQKPTRKSLSLRSPPANSDSVPFNSMYQAVQLGASTRSATGPPGSPSTKRAENTLAVPAPRALAPESIEAKDGQTSPLHKSPANTASFIFAKSPKKLVIDPVTSPEAQAGLQKNLVAELMSYSAPRNADAGQPSHLLNGKPVLQRKPSKIPPPVARKPSQSTPRSPTSPQPWASPRSPLGPQPWAQPKTPGRVQAPGSGTAASALPDVKAAPVSHDEAQAHTVSSEPKDPASEEGRAVQLAGQDPQPALPAAQEEAGS